jgi:predicted deacetylase
LASSLTCPAGSVATNWLPPGKRAAVCFSIDDIHPGTSSDAYEAGGDLGQGVLKHVLWLLRRHPALRITLFVTADWREIAPFPTRRIFAKVPWLRNRLFLSQILPRGTMQLDRHTQFVRFLRDMPRVEIGLHGLYHVHRGPNLLAEFQDESVEECRRILARAMAVFRQAELEFVPGLCPPAWNAPPNLLSAMATLGLKFLASSRDVRTPISRRAGTAMSGMRGMSLLYPELVQEGRLVHLTSNFAASNPIDRAIKIVERGGLLAVKAHAVKHAFGFTALDGLDANYAAYLDLVLSFLENRYGDQLWWTSMDEVAQRALTGAALKRAG